MIVVKYLNTDHTCFHNLTTDYYLYNFAGNDEQFKTHTVPTGIVTFELTNTIRRNTSSRVCPECLNEQYDKDARFCKKCGHDLEN